MHFNTEIFTHLSSLTIQLHWATAIIASFSRRLRPLPAPQG